MRGNRKKEGKKNFFLKRLRYKRICSEAHDRNEQLATLQKGFRQLEYKRDLIASQIHKAVQIPRESFLQY